MASMLVAREQGDNLQRLPASLVGVLKLKSPQDLTLLCFVSNSFDVGPSRSAWDTELPEGPELSLYLMSE